MQSDVILTELQSLEPLPKVIYTVNLSTVLTSAVPSDLPQILTTQMSSCGHH